MPPAKTNKPGKQHGGKATAYTQQRADTVIAGMEAGQSVKQSASDVGVSASTVWQWVTEDRNGFAARYARARLVQADVQFEELQDLERELLAGNLDSQNARVAIETRKWRLSKMRPEQYSDKHQVDVSGKVAHAHAHQHQVQQEARPDLEALTTDELRQYRDLLAKMQQSQEDRKQVESRDGGTVENSQSGGGDPDSQPHSEG
jgi:transposase